MHAQTDSVGMFEFVDSAGSAIAWMLGDCNGAALHQPAVLQLLNPAPAGWSPSQQTWTVATTGKYCTNYYDMGGLMELTPCKEACASNYGNYQPPCAGIYHDPSSNDCGGCSDVNTFTSLDGYSVYALHSPAITIVDSAVVRVTSVSVTVTQLVARLVTSARWLESPPNGIGFSPFSATLELVHQLRQEGNQGRICKSA